MSKGPLPQYVAFLRGINVGGHKSIKMDDLKTALAAMDFQNIRTVLASGNVLFNAPKYTVAALGVAIERRLRESLGQEIGVVVRTTDEIQKLVATAPFKKVKVTPATRLYVTFLFDKPGTVMEAPWESPEKDLRILSISASEICSVVTITPRRNSNDAMAFIEKQFGKQVTTRNWNTIERILKAAES